MGNLPMHDLRKFAKWLLPGIHVKRWLAVMLIGTVAVVLGTMDAFTLLRGEARGSIIPSAGWQEIILALIFGGGLMSFGLFKVSTSILAPYRLHQSGHMVDLVIAHNRRQKGPNVVALGGGTGLPATLRGLKSFTSNITAIVTVADDGGSSGRLRRELGVLPPGDLRNNIAALADDESLMARLFQYRFETGDLGGHAFGNLFITALSGVTGGLDSALVETERVLNIQGRVLPATLDDVSLAASVRLPGSTGPKIIRGETKISAAGGHLEDIWLVPNKIQAFQPSIEAIQSADVIIVGPGSLYTSILPNLLVTRIADAIRSAAAEKIFVCNIATQPGETEGYDVIKHIDTIEKYLGRGIFQTIIANNNYPEHNAGKNTAYVYAPHPGHSIFQRYNVILTDLTDFERPWRHDPHKLGALILQVIQQSNSTNHIANTLLTDV